METSEELQVVIHVYLQLTDVTAMLALLKLSDYKLILLDWFMINMQKSRVS